MSSDLELLEGEWIVKVQGWVWAYTFSPPNKVTWRDTRSPENGSGTWTAGPKSVNINWKGGDAKESWIRPLTPSSKNTWYSSSYYTGRYQIDKKGASASAGSSSSRLLLDKPPHVQQESLYCWAAGASSWLRVRGRGTQTPEQLIEKYGGYLNADGSMPEVSSSDPGAIKGGIRAVYDQIGLRVELVAVKDLTSDYFLAKLKQYGHFLLMARYGGNMGHTYVVYGVGDPTNDHFSVMDPLSGHATKQFSSILGTSAYLGFAK